MHLTNNDTKPHELAVSNAHADEAGAPDEIKVTKEMLNAGAKVIDDLIEAPGGLLYSLVDTARAVYLAMEKERLGIRE